MHVHTGFGHVQGDVSVTMVHPAGVDLPGEPFVGGKRESAVDAVRPFWTSVRFTGVVTPERCGAVEKPSDVDGLGRAESVSQAHQLIGTLQKHG